MPNDFDLITKECTSKNIIKKNFKSKSYAMAIRGKIEIHRVCWEHNSWESEQRINAKYMKIPEQQGWSNQRPRSLISYLH